VWISRSREPQTFFPLPVGPCGRHPIPALRLVRWGADPQRACPLAAKPSRAALLVQGCLGPCSNRSTAEVVMRRPWKQTTCWVPPSLSSNPRLTARSAGGGQEPPGGAPGGRGPAADGGAHPGACANSALSSADRNSTAGSHTRGQWSSGAKRQASGGSAPGRRAAAASRAHDCLILDNAGGVDSTMPFGRALTYRSFDAQWQAPRP